MDQKFLNKYAQVIVRVGVNIAPGDVFVVAADINARDLARELVAEGYRAGAERVVVLWRDEQVTKLDYTLGEGRKMIAPEHWEIVCREEMAERKVAYANILSSDPELLADVDPKLLAEAGRASHKAFAKFSDATRNNHVRWCLFSGPSVAWAKKVRPDMPEEEAVEHLWGLIAHAMRLDVEDSVAAWQEHDEQLRQRSEHLNHLGLVKLHYTNSLGTDLWVELPKDYVFAGGSELSSSGVRFSPNMPTEEVFGAPYKYGVEGRVVASMPLFHKGARIENFGLELHEGRIVKYWAEIGEDILRGIIETDEGSHYLGEVALVPYDSPIQNLKTLFLQTLFDENASCHFAIGDAYPTCVKGGNEMSKEERAAAGLNDSFEHVDFMIGTADLKIEGYLADGSKVDVFVDGNFAF